MGCPDPEALIGLATGSTDPGARGEIADHAAGCSSCHAALSALLAQGGAMAETAVASDAVTPTLPASADSVAGLAAVQQIDRYVVRGRLGAGGMGVVYEAHDPELARDVAIKVLRRGASGARLRREAQALARLHHPHVVAVYDVGTHETQVFVAMALVDGQNLRVWLADERSTDEILRVLREAARGIVAAHTAGLVHRDLKPDNIFVARDGTALVGDFGLARDIGDESIERSAEDIPRARSSGPLVPALTVTGMVLGTPAYMAPEQAEGAATERSDQFSFCVTAYEALYGTRPFPGASFDEILARTRAARLEPPKRERDVPAVVHRAIVRGLAANPDERFPTMAALLAELEPRARRWPWVAGGGAVAAAAVVTTLAVTHSTHTDPERACAAAGAQIDATWNASRRDGFAAALAAHGVGKDPVRELVGRVDGYASRWRAARRDVCRVGGTSAEQQARAACFDARRTKLDELIASLPDDAGADALLAWEEIVLLPSAESCRHAVDGAGSGSGAATRDLELVLVTATGELYMSHVKEAEAALRDALPLAETLDDPGGRVRALALTARLRCLQGRASEAQPLLAQADAGARRLGDADAAEVDELMMARAECAERAEQFDEAVTLLRRYIDHTRQRFGPDTPLELGARYRLAMAYRGLGRISDAAAENSATIRILQRFGSPGVTSVEDQAASDAMARGDLPAAIEHEQRVADLAPSVAQRAGALSTVAAFYEIATSWKLAVALHSEAIRLVGDTDPSAARLRADSRAAIVRARLFLGEHAGLSAEAQRAVDDARTSQDPDLLATARLALGQAWLAEGEHARAARELREALPAYQQTGSVAPFRLGTGQLALAEAEWATGDRDAARAIAREAETNLGKAVDELASSSLAGPQLVAFRKDMLARAQAWRDSHR